MLAEATTDGFWPVSATWGQQRSTIAATSLQDSKLSELATRTVGTPSGYALRDDQSVRRPRMPLKSGKYADGMAHSPRLTRCHSALSTARAARVLASASTRIVLSDGGGSETSAT